MVNTSMVKDLSALNRDLGKVVCVDIDQNAYSLQPENGLLLKAWKGEKDDRELQRMMTFLEGKMSIKKRNCFNDDGCKHNRCSPIAKIDEVDKPQ